MCSDLNTFKMVIDEDPHINRSLDCFSMKSLNISANPYMYCKEIK